MAELQTPADPVMPERFRRHFNSEPMVFDAEDGQGRVVYRTNALALDHGQIVDFFGNALELSANGGRGLALSAWAMTAQRPDQIAAIERSARLLPLDIPSIEIAGGSVRCMLASIHLSRCPALTEG